MKKTIILTMVFVLLSGCGKSAQAVRNDLNDFLSKADQVTLSSVSNMRRSYFDYYLPRHVGKLSTDMENGVFISNNVRFYMNLNTPSVIIESYYNDSKKYNIGNTRYSELKNVGEQFYYNYGELLNVENEMMKYSLYVNTLEENCYFVFLEYGYVDFAAVCYLSEIENLVYDMLSIGRSVKVDKELVIADFSNKVEIVINRQYELFEKILPESGIIADVLYPSDSIIDEGEVDSELEIDINTENDANDSDDETKTDEDEES